MSVRINSHPASALFLADVQSSAVSPAFLSRHATPFIVGCPLSVSLAMTMDRSQYVFSLRLDVRVAENQNGVDLILGSDWFAVVALALSGHSITLSGGVLVFPHSPRPVYPPGLSTIVVFITHADTLFTQNLRCNHL